MKRIEVRGIIGKEEKLKEEGGKERQRKSEKEIVRQRALGIRRMKVQGKISIEGGRNENETGR